ncbi:metal ABC transporter ATP-binding protein [Erwinia psidii]|uniref:ABC transporter ATP-binding protein n=1 Tax=Erwinia psidii TaxID=69224 RepID=A0A3N6SNR3_9GAMM|nr:ABC transporter ATP-binding protein [Erwinia psidii]MCX8958029.1 ABC transporter ATP-binding protein [Erwinia psidii]MCX8962573.1 ABC transporter ATP-binding protein [Erwinia psidii]MCX8963896.1 ABC transporter ATP-binding protein [Erwinia psidii]RQM39396.1 ABC transporter ATP-binding protein [Erwinia psidii]
MISLKSLTVGYQGRAVAPALTGTFLQGSMTALVGANGSGKSTLLKTLAGLLPPVSGSVICDKSRIGVAWLPQQSEIEKNFPISVFDLVAMGCWKRCGWFGAINRSMRQSVMHALERVHMQDFAFIQPGELSGGQLQRVLFARLLVQNASLLLLDEPFTGIDSETTAILLALLEERYQAGCTLIVVLHDMATVEKHFPQTLRLKRNHAEWSAPGELLIQPNFSTIRECQ